MDIRKVKKLIELLEHSGIAELEVHEGKESVRISRTPPANPKMDMQPTNQVIIEPTKTETTLTNRPPEITGTKITSPMVGTMYRAPAPGEAPFVKVGDRVAAGDVLCIVEAMKMLNQIESECGGVIKSILVENGHPVEFGQPLFIIEEN